MARAFDGASDAIDLAAGGVANTSRAVTVVALVRPVDPTFNSLSTNFDVVAGIGSGSVRWAQFVSSKRHFGTGDFGGGPADLGDKDTWYRIVTRRASGGSVAYRHGIAALGGAWSWGNGSVVADGTADVSSVRFGSPAVINNAKLNIAACAVYLGDPFGSDGATEAAITAAMDDWLAASPLAAWQFDQASTSDPVTDLTGGGADQTAISGTTVVADPVGWTYASGSVSGIITATLGGLVATVAGTRRKSGSVVASLGGLTSTVAGTKRRSGAIVAALGGLHATLLGDGEPAVTPVGVLTPGSASSATLTASAAAPAGLVAS